MSDSEGSGIDTVRDLALSGVRCGKESDMVRSECDTDRGGVVQVADLAVHVLIRRACAHRSRPDLLTRVNDVALRE